MVPSGSRNGLLIGVIEISFSIYPATERAKLRTLLTVLWGCVFNQFHSINQDCPSTPRANGCAGWMACAVRTSSIPIPAIERKRIGVKHFRILAEARLQTHTLYHPASACAVNVTCHISVLSDMCAFTRNSLRLRTKTKTRNRTAASGVGGGGSRFFSVSFSVANERERACVWPGCVPNVRTHDPAKDYAY